MKKIILVFLCLFSGFCFAAEPLLLINPSRETFINFPSKNLPNKVITVFLPEPKVPLQGKYPVVYLLGVAPTDREAAQQALARAEQKAILVGINVTEADLAKPAKVEKFVLRDLIPYIDTNYPTLDEPSYRAIAVYGQSGVKAVEKLISHEQVFARALIVHGNASDISLEQASSSLRVALAGSREELLSWLPLTQQKGLAFGPGFVTFISEKASLLGMLQLDYLFGSLEAVKVQQLKGFLSDNSLSLAAQNESVNLTVWGYLANHLRFDFISQDVRIAPPYLNWDAASGVLTVVPGASTGKVKIEVFVDNLVFSDKIKLKK